MIAKGLVKGLSFSELSIAWFLLLALKMLACPLALKAIFLALSASS